jgi:hypothetical protein
MEQIMERTTRKNKMINTVFHALVSGQSELLAVGAKYFNELMNGYYLEHEEVHFNCDDGSWVDNDGCKYSSIDDFCEEVSYWLSCYYESGHCRHEGEEYKDRKAFIKYLEVFKSSCKEKHTRWIPHNKETEFLFA